MGGQGRHEVQCIEALGEDFVKGEESIGIIPCEEIVHHLEAVFVVQDAQVADYVVLAEDVAAEGDALVEDGEGVTHGAIGLGGYYVEGFFIGIYAFLGRDFLEVAHGVVNADAVEVVGLAAAEDGGKNLVLLCGGKNEDGVCRRLLQRLEEGVESGCRQHVNLIYDVYAVLSHLWRNLHLVHQGLDVLYGIV